MSELRRKGIQVILVSSGAVGVGRNLVHREEEMTLSPNERIWKSAENFAAKSSQFNNLFAAAGQVTDFLKSISLS